MSAHSCVTCWDLQNEKTDNHSHDIEDKAEMQNYGEF